MHFHNGPSRGKNYADDRAAIKDQPADGGARGKLLAYGLGRRQVSLGTVEVGERRDFYELLWHTGAAQSDAVWLTAEEVDWNQHTICYSRKKVGNVIG
jgi:hypothetical protein